MDLNLAAFLSLELGDLLGTLPLSRMELLHLTSSSVREATNVGRVLRAVAISSAGSVDFGQEPAKISFGIPPVDSRLLNPVRVGVSPAE